jgi:hypothetical protein
MPFAFEKLIVYQKAIDFADRICKLTDGFPRGCFFLRPGPGAADLLTSSTMRSVQVTRTPSGESDNSRDGLTEH